MSDRFYSQAGRTRRRRRRGFTPASERALERRLKRLPQEAQTAVQSVVLGMGRKIRDAARAVVPVANPRRQRPNPRWKTSQNHADWTGRHIRTAIRVSQKKGRPFARVGLLTKKTRRKHYYHVYIAAGSAWHGRRSKHGAVPFMDLAVQEHGASAVRRIRKAYDGAIQRAWSR